MEDIASEVGMSRPGVYRYFSDRDELLIELVFTRWRSIRDRVHKSIARRNTLADQIDPPEDVPAVEPPVPAPLRATSATEIAVPFTATGNAILMNIELRGPAGRTVLPYLFDTGASFTTVNTKTAEKLGLAVYGSGIVGEGGGVEVDGAGTVFIADWGNDRIIAVATGSAPTTLRVPGLDGPAGVALGDGTLFITDSGNNRVVVRQDRAFRAKALPIALLDNPQGIAADPHGWIYIADWGNDRVLAVTADGRDARTLPFPGLVGPQDVAVDGSGAVYVTDAANNRVLQLSPGASAPVELPLTGLKSPHSIAVDRARTVYVTDRGNNRVVLMTADQTQRTLGLDGLAEPSGIAVDARGVISVTERQAYIGRVRALAKSCCEAWVAGERA